jgi:AhpD family alkylhydroperoxidase
MAKSKCCSNSLFSPAVAELVAIGAAIASNCEPCFKYHYAKAKKLGVNKDDIAKAVATANGVKEAPAESVLKLANKILGVNCAAVKTHLPTPGTCCGAKK